MIKDILRKNEIMTPNSREIAVLREHFPACFKSDGSFDFERFRGFLNDKLTVTHEGYELKFLGKNYARLLASAETTTVIVPDEIHNSKPENTNSENIYISGDNLDGLKHLLKSYSRQVKCIYIDPPYNTGSDGFVYNDSFNFSAEELSEKLSISEEQAQRVLDLTKRGSASHSAWLMFMYPRLLLARDLLANEGVVFISIDSNELSNLKLLCDDVFGEENALTVITRSTGTPTGGGFDIFVNETDYVVGYARNAAKVKIFGLEMSEEDASIYNETDENGRRYLTRTLRRTGGEDRREDRPTMYYPVTAPDGTEVFPVGPTGYESRWICGYDTYCDLLEDGMIEWKKQGDIWTVYQRFYLEGRQKQPGNLWTAIEGNKKATRQIRSLFGTKKVFETAKPLELLTKLITLSCESNDIVVDFFSGSATTAHAVMQLNAADKGTRKFIAVQWAEAVREGSEAEKAGFTTIDQIGIERIIRAAAAIRETGRLTPIEIDLGFKHYTLAEPSQNTLDKLEKFDPDDSTLVASDLLTEFGKTAVLATWLNHDGYGLTTGPEELNFAGYKGYFIGKHLYLIDEHLSNEAIEAILTRIETNGDFNPENIVLFGYSFLWTEREALQINLKRLKATEKNLRVNFDIRY